MKLHIDDESINFSEGQIKTFMVDLDMTYLESVLYLWFFNNVGITAQDRSRDCGRPMYIKFAKGLGKLIKESN